MDGLHAAWWRRHGDRNGTCSRGWLARAANPDGYVSPHRRSKRHPARASPGMESTSSTSTTREACCPPQILDSREADEKANIPEPFANRSRADQRDLDGIIADHSGPVRQIKGEIPPAHMLLAGGRSAHRPRCEDAAAAAEACKN